MDGAVYEFGDVRVDLGRMAATRAGAPISLEPKAFDVLVHLIERRDRLVTKEELLDAVWTGTFVTPNVLTRAIAQIRKALGDESHGARYIETVARRGYRFIAPVRMPGAVDPVAVAPPPPPPARRLQPRVAISAVIALGLIAAAIAAFYARIDTTPSDPAPPGLELRRITNRRGFSATPALSPDGRQLVYASDASGSIELYLSSLTPGSAEVQLTKDGGHNMQPAWSPDGQWIAFHSRARGGVWIIPSMGGPAQQVADFGSNPAWSPDSTTLVFTSDAGGLAAQSSLWTVKRDGTRRTPLTRVGSPAGGHRSPVWSHDGRLVAFTVAHGGWRIDLWTVTVATGEAHQVDSSLLTEDPCFSPDDRAIIWGGATPTANARVFRRAIDADGKPVGATETIFPMDAGIVEGLTLAANGALAFAARTLDANLWAVDVRPDGRVSEPVRLTDDVARNTHPDYSRDGRVLYLQQSVGAPASVWMMREDGSERAPFLPGTRAVNPQWDLSGSRAFVLKGTPEEGLEPVWVDVASRKATPIPHLGRMWSPRLSPDATELAYHAIEGETISVWTARLDGMRRRVATDREAVSYPAYSPDGRWLAVEIKRGDSTQIGVVPRGGGEVVQLTSERGQSWPHSWAPDNDRIAFAGERAGVWNLYTVSRTTRAVTQLTGFTSATGYVRYPNWSPAGSRIIFERAMETANVWTASLDTSRR